MELLGKIFSVPSQNVELLLDKFFGLLVEDLEHTSDPRALQVSLTLSLSSLHVCLEFLVPSFAVCVCGVLFPPACDISTRLPCPAQTGCESLRFLLRNTHEYWDKW